MFSGTFTASPGKLSRRNQEELFSDSRPGAQPRYFIGQFWVQRQTVLAKTLIHTARLSGQISSARLVPSEQFSIGGANTIRGYEERILNGDAGAWFSQEVQKTLPAIPLGKRWPRLESTVIAFWDYGRSFIRQPRANEVPDAFLSSVGLGARFGLGNYLSASAELGKQIERVEIPGAPSHRLHVKVSFSF